MMRGSKRLAIVVGHAYHGARLAELIDMHCIGWRARYIHGGRAGALRSFAAAFGADAVISLGGPAPHSAVCEVAQGAGAGVIVMWTGADVARARDDPDFLALGEASGLVHLADAPWLVEDLARLGVHARYVPVTPAPAAATAPFPTEFRMLSHVPTVDDALGAHRFLFATARTLPSVPFSVIGRAATNPAAPSNVHFLGYVKQLDACIDAHCAVMRFSHDDGASPLILQALAHGRHAIWNYPFEGVRCVRTWTQAIEAIVSLREAHARGALALNDVGQRAVAEHFSPASLAAGIERELDAACRDRSVRARSPASRVAISGRESSVARVIALARASETSWELRPVRARTRLAAIAAIATLARADVWYDIGPPTNRWLRAFASVLRKPRVIHWSESDVPRADLDRHARPTRGRTRVVHLAESEAVVEQLRAAGIDARPAPLPPRKIPASVPPLPDDFTILLVPADETQLYERVIRSLHRRPVRFVLVGGRAFALPAFARIERSPWRDDLSDLYARSTVVVRLGGVESAPTVHLEALAHGRHVISSAVHPYVRTARSVAEVCANIDSLLTLHAAGRLLPLAEAAAYVAATYDPASCVARIRRAWEEAAGPAR